MIKLRRGPTPAPLAAHGAQWTRELLEAIQQHAPRKAPYRFWSRYNRADVKEALRAMSHEKCVYCESRITHIDYGDIEHYRPKSLYPHLTFQWENLLLACGVCNGAEQKGSKFPLQDEDESQPLLLNPCEDEPRDHLAFDGAWLVPRTPRGEATRDILGLNRDALFDQRRKLFRMVDYIRRRVELDRQAGNQERADAGHLLLEEAASAQSDYAGMVRAFMAKPLPDTPPL